MKTLKIRQDLSASNVCQAIGRILLGYGEAMSQSAVMYAAEAAAILTNRRVTYRESGETVRRQRALLVTALLRLNTSYNDCCDDKYDDAVRSGEEALLMLRTLIQVTKKAAAQQARLFRRKDSRLRLCVAKPQSACARS